MDLATFFADKRLDAKQRSTELARRLLDKELKPDVLTYFAITAKDPERSVCLKAFELASRTSPALISPLTFELAWVSLASPFPPVKREAGRLIGNTAGRFPEMLDQAIPRLLANTSNSGAIVRWSAAFALSGIIKLGTAHNATLVPRVEKVMEAEEKASIRKLYAAALGAMKA